LRQRIIGLFGGSFDPPHLGHLALAQQALAHRLVDEVWLVPVGQPVHRRLSGCADGELRAQWLRQMTAKMPSVHVWDWEVRQPHAVAAIETLRAFTQAYPQDRSVWLMGADALQGFERWIGYPEHRRYCDLVVFARVGCALPHIDGWQQLSEQAWPARQGSGHVLYMQAPLPDISATELRRRLRAGESVAGMVDETIMDELRCRYGVSDGHDSARHKE